jgi:hypothetical protein
MSGWVLDIAVDISDTGYIVGTGTFEGQTRGFLLTPVPEPSTFVLAACGAVAILVVAARRRRSGGDSFNWSLVHILRRGLLMIDWIHSLGARSIPLFVCLIAPPLTLLGSPGTLRSAPILWSTGSGGNGHYYESVSTPMTWEDANLAASAMLFLGENGHLATITSQAENDFLVANFVNPQFLGGYQPDGSSEPDGDWAWVTGETWSYTNWAPGEPNNSLGTEKYLEFFAGGPRWNDIFGTATRTFLVEYDIVPEPSTLVLVCVGAAACEMVALTRPMISVTERRWPRFKSQTVRRDPA